MGMTRYWILAKAWTLINEYNQLTNLFCFYVEFYNSHGSELRPENNECPKSELKELGALFLAFGEAMTLLFAAPSNFLSELLGATKDH